MKGRLVVGLGVLTFLLVWMMAAKKPSSPVKAMPKDVERIKDDKPPKQQVVEDSRTPDSVPAVPEKVWPEKPFSYQKELDAFLALKEKVLPSADEQSEMRRLLTDASLLRAVGLRLTEASLAPTVKASQDAAVSLLVDALKAGEPMASEIARQVVEDPQVENASFDRAVRENLAGIKAEVLYHWAALAPDEAANIERSLPGPVSQKIWANVAHRHASNRAESATSP